MVTWTRERLRHAATFFKQGRNPAAAVYDSIGPDFFLALDDGWLNLGLWHGDGSDPDEAPIAVRRLVETLGAELPKGGAILDVGNGLGAQDPFIARMTEPAPRNSSALKKAWVNRWKMPAEYAPTPRATNM